MPPSSAIDLLPSSPGQVYGSDQERANALRAWSDGKLVMESTPVGPMLPRNTGGFPNANDARAYPDDQLFFAGGKAVWQSRLSPCPVPTSPVVGILVVGYEPHSHERACILSHDRGVSLSSARCTLR